MPVSSHRNSRFKEMTKAKQYFPIGEEFMYTPKSDPSVTLRLVPVTEMSGGCRGCAIVKYCNESNCDHYGGRFIPECHAIRRPDCESVIFREM